MNERNARRWLLTLELLLTTGPEDPLRVWPDLLAGFLRAPSRTYEEDVDSRDCDKPSDAESFQFDRLKALGLLALNEEGYRWYFNVHPTALRLFEDILKTPETPFGVLASAMLADRERLTFEQEQPTPSPPETSSVSTAIRHAQLVTHEIRNRLGPARHALSDLHHVLSLRIDAAATRPHLERIDRAVARVFDFVTDQQKIVAVGGPGDEVFDPASAIESAVLTAKNGAGAPIEVDVQGALPPVFGAEGHFVMVLLNVIRNGLRAIPEGGRVRLQADSPSGDLRLTIEDDGPGVPAGIAPYIFHSGFSTWAGSGLGLALARDTLTAWGGDIRHEPVLTGGARFIITLPGASKR